ncbi:hypothetical protein WN943_017423 [Citrus x changshan-huyou]
MANKSFDSGSGSTAAFNMMVPRVSMTLMLFSSHLVEMKMRSINSSRETSVKTVLNVFDPPNPFERNTENRTLKLRSFKQALINFGLGSDRVNPIRTPTPMQNIGDELGKVSLLHSLP